MTAISKEKILILAVAGSLAWHVLWLSLIKVSSAEVPADNLGFSKVSFLGPILGGGAVELRVAPAEMSLPEKRFMNYVGEIADTSAIRQERPRTGFADARRPRAASYDKNLTNLIDSAISGSKLQPAQAAQQ